MVPHLQFGIAVRSRSITATKLAVVVLNIAAIAEVVQAGIFHFSIFLLAAGFEGVSVDMNVLAGLGKRASGAVIAIPVAPVIIMISISVPISIMIMVAPVAIISVSAGATEVSVQVLDFSAAAIKVTKLSVAPVAALVLAGGTQR